MSEPISMTPIGVVESCYGEKFGTPRQSGLVESAFGRIIFNKDVDPEACRGLEEFSHLWIVFLFDQVTEADVRWLVRPPRLGGNEKKGVLATRSPFRPNRIGLSLVKLEEVGKGFLSVSGLDFVTGTPVLDVKPYLPYVESIPEACGGFAEKAPEPMRVEVSPEIQNQIESADLKVIIDSLSIDPRPAYHHDPERVYGCYIAGYHVKWKVDSGHVLLLGVSLEDRKFLS